jgi:hypothetical protein
MSTAATQNPGRRKLRYASIDAAIADVQSLRRGYTQCGNWNLPQISWHLTTVLDRSSRPATEPATPEQLKMRPVLEQILAGSQLPIRIEAPAAAVPAPTCSDADIDALIAALRRLAVYPEKTAVHRLFGPLSLEQFKALSLIHCAHHLSHLTPTTPATAST